MDYGDWLFSFEPAIDTAWLAWYELDQMSHPDYQDKSTWSFLLNPYAKAPGRQICFPEYA